MLRAVPVRAQETARSQEFAVPERAAAHRRLPERHNQALMPLHMARAAAAAALRETVMPRVLAVVAAQDTFKSVGFICSYRIPLLK